MAKDYTGLAARASSLVQRFGKAAVTVTVTSNTVPDADRPWEITSVQTDHAVTAVRIDYSDAEIDGTNIRAGDRKYLVAANDLTIVPKPGYIVTDGADFSVEGVQTTAPGGTDIIYELHVRLP